MKIYLIRHGVTRLGEEKRYQGRTDAPLSEGGRASLRRADFDPERVYVTSLCRTAETASILFPSARLIAVPDLREMDFGAFEGRGYWEMEDDADYRAWVDGKCEGRCPGGEDRPGFFSRVCKAFEDVLRREAGADSLVIVAHGGTQMGILDRWGKPERMFNKWQRPCGCGWLLEREDDGSLRVLKELDYTT